MTAQWQHDLRDEQEQRMALHSVQVAEGFAAQDHSLTSLTSEQVTVLLVRLATLEAMAQRAQSIVDAGSVDDPDDSARGWYLAARNILGT